MISKLKQRPVQILFFVISFALTLAVQSSGAPPNNA